VKIIAIKMPIQQEEMDKKGVEGFSKGRSIMIDSLVVIFYAIKFLLSQ